MDRSFTVSAQSGHVLAPDVNNRSALWSMNLNVVGANSPTADQISLVISAYLLYRPLKMTQIIVSLIKSKF